MAIVTDIQQNKSLTRIYLDGVSWLTVRRKHFVQLCLQSGDVIDPDQYIDRLAALQTADCYEAALTMLDQAAQTSGDMCVKLKRKGFVSPAAEACVNRLLENGLLDDARYAERVAQSQLNKAIGSYAVRRKLMAKRLPEDAIEDAMSIFDQEQQLQACRDAASKLWQKYAPLPPREGRAKLTQALARRGFDWESIRSAVDALTNDSDDYDYD